MPQDSSRDYSGNVSSRPEGSVSSRASKKAKKGKKSTLAKVEDNEAGEWAAAIADNDEAVRIANRAFANAEATELIVPGEPPIGEEHDKELSQLLDAIGSVEEQRRRSSDRTRQTAAATRVQAAERGRAVRKTGIVESAVEAVTQATAPTAAPATAAPSLAPAAAARVAGPAVADANLSEPRPNRQRHVTQDEPPVAAPSAAAVAAANAVAAVLAAASANATGGVLPAASTEKPCPAPPSAAEAWAAWAEKEIEPTPSTAFLLHSPPATAPVVVLQAAAPPPVAATPPPVAATPSAEEMAATAPPAAVVDATKPAAPPPTMATATAVLAEEAKESAAQPLTNLVVPPPTAPRPAQPALPPEDRQRDQNISSVGTPVSTPAQACEDPKPLIACSDRPLSLFSALNEHRKLASVLKSDAPNRVDAKELKRPPNFSPDKRDKDGDRVPLHWAAARGSVECVRLLIEAGATIGLTDKSGCTAAALALQYNQTEAHALIMGAVNGDRAARKPSQEVEVLLVSTA